jgi:glycosyltransferase involved in cell wall biosynthesis
LRIVSGSVSLLRLNFQYKPTHVHVCNIAEFINFLPALLTMRVPVIFRVGDIPATHRKAFGILWTKIVVPRVARFVCVSEYVKSSLLALDVPESKCRVIYSQAPVRSPQIAPDGTGVIHKGRDFTVLYVGQLTSDKGIDLLIGAAIQMCRERDEIEFLIAGDYEWEKIPSTALIECVRVAGLSDRIRFLGYVNAIPDLFQLSDLHVVPSVCEDALPNVVIEAKQAGVASVAFSSGGVSEVIEHGIDGYICAARDEANLVAGIEYYIDTPGRASDHGRNAYSSLSRLGVTRFGELWDSVYADV